MVGLIARRRKVVWKIVLKPYWTLRSVRSGFSGTREKKKLTLESQKALDHLGPNLLTPQKEAKWWEFLFHDKRLFSKRVIRENGVQNVLLFCSTLSLLETYETRIFTSTAIYSV
jgi:hypothetical protein